MALSKNFTVVADSAVDADSPVDVALMTNLRDNDIHLEEWLGKDYTAAENHNHNGVNSSLTSTPPAGLSAQTAGDWLMSSNDTARTTTSSTYVKLKETKIAKGGTYRIKFTLREISGGPAVYGRIYKNGVAVGTERAVSAQTEYTEDISGFASGDLIQVYGHNTTCEVKNFRLYGADPGDFGINESY